MCSVLQIRSVAVPTVTANISKKKEKLEFRTLVCLSESSGGPPKLSRITQNTLEIKDNQNYTKRISLDTPQ